ncbi:MAG: agmatinase [Pseudomonadota bacterium]
MDESQRSDLAFTAAAPKHRDSETTYSGALSFLRRKYSRDLAGVDLAVTGIPLDTATTNRPGTRFGPRALRAASCMLPWERPYGLDFHPFELISMVDYGDCSFDFGRPLNTPGAIQSHVAEIINTGSALLSMGGDHFITYPVLKAHAAKHGQLSLVHFDAHSDTWDDTGGEDRIDHGTMFFHAAKQGLVDPSRSAQIGLRTHNDDTHGFNIFDAPCVHNDTPEGIAAKVRKIVGDHPVYLTFDIDCLDPCYAPGTGTPVCGGLSTHQAQQILRNLMGINLVGMDIVEVAPAYDIGEITALAGATLAYEMVALFAKAHTAA